MTTFNHLPNGTYYTSSSVYSGLSQVDKSSTLVSSTGEIIHQVRLAEIFNTSKLKNRHIPKIVDLQLRFSK